MSILRSNYKRVTTASLLNNPRYANTYKQIKRLNSPVGGSASDLRDPVAPQSVYVKPGGGVGIQSSLRYRAEMRAANLHEQDM